MTAEKIDQFAVVREIAKCSHGSLFKATDPGGRIVAIRTLEPASPDPASADMVQRLLKAARKTATLSSQNIAAVYEVSEREGVSYVVLEYVEGISLGDRIAKKEKFSIWDLIDISRQVCLALDHAHAHGILHRDLHPGNILETWDGTIKLLGFNGLVDTAKAAQGAVPENLCYWSPEKIRRQPLDGRSDLFSWGAILYEMATGRKAFGADSIEAVVRKIASEQPLPPTQIETGMDAGLAHVIMKALSKAPSERHQNGAELLRELEACNKPVLGPSPSPGARPSEAPIPEGPAAQVAEPVYGVASKQVSESPTLPLSAPCTISIKASPPSMSGNLKPESAPQELTGPATAGAGVPPPTPPPEVCPPPSPLRARYLDVFSRLAGVIRPKLRRLAAHSKLELFLYGLYAGTALLALIIAVDILRPRAVDDRVESAPVSAPAPDAPVSTPPEQAVKEEPATEPVSEPAAVRVSPKTRKTRPAPAHLSPGYFMTTELVIDSSPQGASIDVDGRRHDGCVTPCTIAGLAAGQHTIILSKPGYTSESRSVEAAAAAKSVLLLQLAPATAQVSISSDPPGASVLLDGKETGRVTPSQIVLSPGSHTFTVRKAGFLDAVTTADLKPGQALRFNPILSSIGNPDGIKTVGRVNKMLRRGSDPEMGRVQLNILPKGGRIFVNQKLMEKSAPADFLFPPGHYEIRVTLAGYSPYQTTINVTAGADVVIAGSLQK